MIILIVRVWFTIEFYQKPIIIKDFFSILASDFFQFHELQFCFHGLNLVKYMRNCSVEKSTLKLPSFSKYEYG